MFQPLQAYRQGQQYTVKLLAGVESTNGRELKQEISWQFQVSPPGVAYLGPVDNLVQNLYMLDPAHPDAPQQLTNSQYGITGFDSAPDGNSLVYAELGEKGTASINQIDLTSRVSRLLYDCRDAMCSSPVFRPDGGAIAFEKVALNLGTGMAPGVPRVWVLDLATNTAQPLFADNQQLGYGPRWSPDGSRLAVYNVNAGGIVIHNFNTKQDSVIRTVQGEVGNFSPDGRWLSFPKVVALSDGRYVTHHVLVDLTSEYLSQTDLVPDNDPADDKESAWMPDSARLLVARPSPGGQVMAAPQIFQVDLTTGNAVPLIEDQGYSQSNLVLSPTGDRLLFQRFSITKPGARTEIWMYDFATRALTKLIDNATFGRWIP